MYPKGNWALISVTDTGTFDVLPFGYWVHSVLKCQCNTYILTATRCNYSTSLCIAFICNIWI